jgi:hypothetical protein
MVLPPSISTRAAVGGWTKALRFFSGAGTTFADQLVFSVTTATTAPQMFYQVKAQ